MSKKPKPDKKPKKEKKAKVRKVKGRYRVTSGKKNIAREEFTVYRVNIKERKDTG